MQFWHFLNNLVKFVFYQPPVRKCNYKYSQKYNKYLKTNKLNGGNNNGDEKNAERKSFWNRITISAKGLKKFAKKYWFIVLPVHGALTISYITLFYSFSNRNNVLSTLKWLDIDEKAIKQARPTYIPHLSKKALKNIAVTMILLKLSTPVRYTTTFLGCKWFVKYLKRRNIIQCLCVKSLNDLSSITDN